MNSCAYEKHRVRRATAATGSCLLLALWNSNLLPRLQVTLQDLARTGHEEHFIRCTLLCLLSRCRPTGQGCSQCASPIAGLHRLTCWRPPEGTPWLPHFQVPCFTITVGLSESHRPPCGHVNRNRCVRSVQVPRWRHMSQQNVWKASEAPGEPAEAEAYVHTFHRPRQQLEAPDGSHTLYLFRSRCGEAPGTEAAAARSSHELWRRQLAGPEQGTLHISQAALRASFVSGAVPPCTAHLQNASVAYAVPAGNAERTARVPWVSRQETLHSGRRRATPCAFL